MLSGCAGDSAPETATPRCPRSEQQISGSIFDYGEDVPGGPATPEVALHAFVAGAYPRLVDARFDETETGAFSREYLFSDRARGQMFLHFEKMGDSWGIVATSACVSVESWARGEAR